MSIFQLARAAAAAAIACGVAASASAQAAATQMDKKSQPVSTEEAVVGLIKIDGGLAERPGPFDWLTGEGSTTLRSVHKAIAGVGDDPAMRALVLQLEDAALGSTQVEELIGAIESVQADGKRVIVVADSLGPTELRLGAAADQLIGEAGAGLSLPGMHMEEMYLRDMLDWVGAEPSYVQVGEFKGADEMMTRSTPSAAWDSNISQLLDSMYANLREPFLSGRGMTDAELDAAMSEAWFASVEDGVRLGLVDRAVPLNDLTDEIGSQMDAEVSWRTGLLKKDGGVGLDPSNPFAIFSVLTQEPKNSPTRPSIAVVHIDGAIVDGDSTQGGLFGSQAVGSRTIRRIADTLRDDDLIRGVVIRINSPGGSATASEIMWQAFRSLAETKPVYVSVGSMAASGGYYVAVAGDRVYVNPSSIVGSIGVVGGKIGLSGVMENLQVNIVRRSRGPMAGIFGSAAWTDAEREAVRERIGQTYDLFTSRVAQGREGIDLDETAAGRLFTGSKAIELDMADELGSISTAITDLAEELGLERYDVLDYPGPQSFEDLLDQFGLMVTAQSGGLGNGLGNALGASIGAGMISSLEDKLTALVGPAWPMVRSRIDAAIMLGDQPVTVLEHRILSFE
ncbi:MAG: S49 family peptidase [Planctomycetota bacterium]